MLIFHELQQHIEAQVKMQKIALESSKSLVDREAQQVATKRIELTVTRNKLAMLEQQLQVNTTAAHKAIKQKLDAIVGDTTEALDRGTAVLVEHVSALMMREDAMRVKHLKAVHTAAASEAKLAAGVNLVTRLREQLVALHKLAILAQAPAVVISENKEESAANPPMRPAK
jgi:hypothetical protein